MQTYKIDDPRDALSRGRLSHILRFARERGIKEIADVPEIKAIEARPIIRSKGLAGAFAAWARDNVQFTPLGQAPGRPEPVRAITSDQANSVDAEADMARQFAEQRRRDAVGTVPLDAMGINELRAECKRLEIKLDRRDNMKSLREKIEAVRNGQNAA